MGTELRRRPIAAALLVIGLAGAGLAAVGAGPASAAAPAEITRPPMGWAAWNTFAAKIDASVIRAQADALVASGMKDAGYEYVNIDEGWWQGTRDSAGNITVDPNEWPGGMKAIADYIHGKGLKAGIYTDAGRAGCGYYYPTGHPAAPNSGSEGHYDQDFLQFSTWGFDFVKVDWCGGQAEGLDARTAYTQISDAIARATARTGRPLVLSVCNWGDQSPWDWAPSISNLWRTSQDIIYYGESASMSRVLANFDSAQHANAQSPGHVNDPDMLVVGMNGFNAAQSRTHLGLWAVSGAPLLAGNDLAKMSAETKAILTNREVIAVDQDPLGRQGTKVSEAVTGRQVYSKVLSGTGRQAVLLLNRTGSAASIPVSLGSLGLSGSAAVRNLWTGTDLGSASGSYTATVYAGEAVLLSFTQAGTTTTTTTRPVTTTTTTASSTSTTTTTSRTSSTTTTGAGSTACTAAYAVTGSWPGGFQGGVTVTAGRTITSWRVTWTLASGQAISQSWGADVATSGSAVTATNAAWNGSLAAGASTTFGFIGTATGSNPVPAVTCTAA